MSESGTENYTLQLKHFKSFKLEINTKQENVS